jgi:hypothetical protein
MPGRGVLFGGRLTSFFMQRCMASGDGSQPRPLALQQKVVFLQRDIEYVKEHVS